MDTLPAHSDESLAFREGTGQTSPRVRRNPGDAFALARDWVRAGRQLDMVELARELGISRGTLYRWTGDRDRLLADVVWVDLAAILDHSWSRAPGHGATRLQTAASYFLDAISFRSAVRSLLANEGDGALRMLTAPRGPIRPRLVARVAELIALEVDAGAYRAPASPEILAEGIVSLGERFLHHGGDPSLNPDPQTAQTVVGLLLREAPPPVR